MNTGRKYLKKFCCRTTDHFNDELDQWLNIMTKILKRGQYLVWEYWCIIPDSINDPMVYIRWSIDQKGPEDLIK